MPKLLQGKDLEMVGRVNREFRDLTVEELVRGYIWLEREESYTCIYCGKVFEEGVVFPSGPRLLTAEKAAREHVARDHGGSFACLLSMDKQISGLTEIQKNVLQCFYDNRDTEEICRLMGISPATVRTHRHNLQKMKREAKILLALMEQVEGDDKRPVPAQVQSDAGLEKREAQQEQLPEEAAVKKIPSGFTGNSLHPFFTQRKFD